jgi:glycosyltransferase involved in cell wall biosynthesis
LNASDVILVTSLSEGSPTIVKEALACNRPIVSVAVGDVATQVEGISGCYIAAADRAALAGKLKLVYSGPGHVSGRERIADQSLEPTAERLKHFYEEVVARQVVGMSAEIG